MIIKTTFKRDSKSLLIWLSLLLVVIIGIFDYLTGPVFSSLIAYLIPVIFVTRLAGRTAGIFISVTSATSWILAEVLSDPDHSFLLVHFWNLLEKLGIFLIVVFILLKLAKIENERNNLLSMLAHDMKNPALVAKGFLERLQKGKAGLLSKQQEKYVRIINLELSRLEQLITDFLDISKFQSRKFKLNRQPFDIVPKLKNHIEALRIEAEKKNVCLVQDFPEENRIRVHADITQIDRVIRNIVQNAIKYSSAGGTVKVTLSRQDKAVLVQVRDSGKGISEEHLEHVFEPFYRITNDHSGSGLGLPIAKSIIKAHGGELWAESKPGKGTVFCFTLPQTHTDLDVK